MVAVAVVVAVSAPPSASERLSSTFTVSVIASVPVGCGCDGAGAIVSVVDVAADSFFRHATSASVTAINTMIFFTESPLFARDAP